MENKFINKQTFSDMVLHTVQEKSLGYMESILSLCEDNKIEVEDVKKYLTPAIKSKLEYEAQQLNMVDKNKETLPL